MNSFKEILLKYLGDQAGEHLDALTRFKVYSVQKGTILQHGGDDGPKSFFVRRGCLRSYLIDSKGKEHIFLFAPEGWIVGDISAVTSGHTSQLFVDAIEDSEVEEIDPSDWGAELGQMLSKSAVPAQVLLNRISVLQKRVIMLMSASAMERYVDFCETYPTIVQRVPQKMIASYLGVTPEALSKLRGSMAKGHP